MGAAADEQTPQSASWRSWWRQQDFRVRAVAYLAVDVLVVVVWLVSCLVDRAWYFFWPVLVLGWGLGLAFDSPLASTWPGRRPAPGSAPGTGTERRRRS